MWAVRLVKAESLTNFFCFVNVYYFILLVKWTVLKLIQYLSSPLLKFCSLTIVDSK